MFLFLNMMMICRNYIGLRIGSRFQATCSLYLSGCESASANRCIELAAGEEAELEMCYSPGAREGAWALSSTSYHN